MYRTYIICLIIAFFTISSCINDSIKTKMETFAPKTVSIGDKFYENLMAENYDATYDMFSMRLFADYSREDIIDMISQIREKHGQIQYYELVNTSFKTSTRHGTQKHTINNYYRVIYSSGYVALEQLMYQVEKNTDSLQKIDAYSFKKFTNNEFE